MESSLLDLENKFEVYSSQNYVPNKAKQKIALIKSLINGISVQLTKYRLLKIDDLELIIQLPQNKLIEFLKHYYQLFLNNQGKHIIFQKHCRLEKEGFINSQHNVLVTCDWDRMHFYIKRFNHYKEYLSIGLEDLQITNQFKVQKGKLGFTLLDTKNNTQYHLFFETDEATLQAKERIENALRDGFLSDVPNQQNSQKIITKSIVQSISCVRFEQENVPNQKCLKDENSKNLEKSSFRDQIFQLETKQKQQILMTQEFSRDQLYRDLVQNIKQQMEDQLDFKLLKNIRGGQILLHQKKQNRYKILLLLNTREKPENILEALCEENRWNTQIQTAQILAKIQDNYYVIQKIFKSFESFYYKGCFTTQRKAIKYENEFFLIQKPSEELKNQHDFIEGKLQSFIQLTKKTENQWQLNYIVQINFEHLINFKKSNNEILPFLQDFQHLETYINLKLGSKNRKYLFQFEIQCISFAIEDHQIQKQLKVNKKRRFSTQATTMDLNCCDSELRDKNIHTQNQQKINLPSLLEEPEQESPLFKKFESIQSPLYNQKLRIEYNFQAEQFYGMIPNKKVDSIMYQFAKEISRKQKYYLYYKFCSQFSHKSSKTIKKNLLTDANWKLAKNNKIAYANEEILKNTSGIIQSILKNIGQNLISGKSVMSISLPAKMLSPMTILQEIAETFASAPIHMGNAANMLCPIQQIKQLTLFLLSMPLFAAKIQRSFNSYIGETFQGVIGGVPIYLEQISQSTAAFLMIGKGFKFYGNIQIISRISWNSIIGFNLNKSEVQFENINTKFFMKDSAYEVGGILIGSNYFRPLYRAFIYEQTQKLLSQIDYPKASNLRTYFGHQLDWSAAGVNGIICKAKTKYLINLSNDINNSGNGSLKGVSSSQIRQIIGTFHGRWFGNIYYNGVLFRDIQECLGYEIYYDKVLLPSDSVFRLDVLYKKLNNYQQSEKQTTILQDMQIKDANLRLKNSKY